MPDVPTSNELGYKIQDVPAWWGIFGPAMMPPEAVRSVHETVVKATLLPSFKAFVRDNGLD
jgi:tripartite-type tricarboxylate transporter receptor subunit TctC